MHSHVAGERKSNTHLITGVTGFVGAALTLELLRTNERATVLCLVRGNDAGHVESRLRSALTAAAAAYDVDEVQLASIVKRATALRGDLTRVGLGLCDADTERLASAGPLTVWHSAATLKDTEEALREIVQNNVKGTENLLETVLQHSVKVFNHISTAYVAGRSSGTVAEQLGRPRGFCNRYEQSKHYGEMMVVDHCRRAGVPYRVMRPAIVIAHSTTGRATGYTGFFGWVLKVAALNEMSGGALTRRPLRYVARADAPLNVIPIDSLVEDAVAIDAAGESSFNRVFHLTNSSSPTIRWLADQVTTALGLLPVEMVADDTKLDPLSAKFHRWTRFERPYTMIPKNFSRVESNQLYTSPRYGKCALDAELVSKMTRLAVQDYQRIQAAEAARRVG